MDNRYSDLSVTQQGGYKRIALANEEESERLTLDLDLWFQSKNDDKRLEYPNFFIAELKQQKKSIHSPFYKFMRENNFAPASFSKYCIGCAVLYGTTIKKNQFKSIISHIQKY